jgi:hypothetical protein
MYVATGGSMMVAIHITPGLQAAAAKSFDEAFTNGYNDKRVSQVV